MISPRLDVVIIYDDPFKDKSINDGVNATTRVERIMEHVNAMFSEESFGTRLEVRTIEKYHAEGKNWGDVRNWNLTRY